MSGFIFHILQIRTPNVDNNNGNIMMYMIMQWGATYFNIHNLEQKTGFFNDPYSTLSLQQHCRNVAAILAQYIVKTLRQHCGNVAVQCCTATSQQRYNDIALQLCNTARLQQRSCNVRSRNTPLLGATGLLFPRYLRLKNRLS